VFEQLGIQETLTELKTDGKKGLSSAEAGKRLRLDGPNEMKEARKKTLIGSFLEQLNDPLIYVLIVAAGVSILLQEISDAFIICAVVLMNAVVGMLQEGKARKALESLKKLTSPKAVVIRDGRRMEIPAANLVKGDLVCLEAGCQVPADLRLLEAANLKIEESALTGESLPIEKNADFQGRKGVQTPLGDRLNMAYMSTIVTYGRGEGVVTATGMHTELGQIAAMITEAKEEMTPLQKRLGELGKVLSLLSLALCAALFIIAVLQKRNVPEMLITAISLAVAAVPEGLPAVVTICLALSVTRMVKVNTIVRRLPSVETLGAVSVVCSDKTGTLTQNRMTVEKCYLKERLLPADEMKQFMCPDFFLGMSLCNDAVADKESRMGDPTELALLDLCGQMGLDRESLEQRFPRTGELPFDSDRKMMTTIHGQTAYTKGAPDEVLKRCTRILTENGVVRMTEEHRRRIRRTLEELAGEALRTLAVAMRTEAASLPNTYTADTAGPYAQDTFGHGGDRRGSFHASGMDGNAELRAASVSQAFAISRQKSRMASEAGENGRGKRLRSEHGSMGIREDELIFLGLVAMRDPARPEAARAVADFKGAGVATVMITGDHVDTAFAIGRQLGIVGERVQCMTGEEMNRLSDEEFDRGLERIRVFARVSPAQKVRIVDGFKRRGEIVAMTGDGVNDAPSLKKADIGIAMGMSGTDVARQAADMVLTDDNFATIRRAIEEGRGVYENIRKSVIFLLSSNLGEIITMFLAVICGLAAPLKSSHILWINLITDSLPALALGVDKNDGAGLMRQAPRKAKESLFARGGLACTLFYGALIAAVSLTAFLTVPCTLLHIGNESVTLRGLTGILQDRAVLSKAQTYAFTVLGMSQLFHAVGMRDTQKSFFRMNHLENKLMIAACGLGFLLQFVVTELPFLIKAFGTSPLSGNEWMHLSVLAAMPLLAHEVMAFMGYLKKGT